jgi:16S rRNA G527 N7-methylase RsmG
MPKDNNQNNTSHQKEVNELLKKHFPDSINPAADLEKILSRINAIKPSTKTTEQNFTSAEREELKANGEFVKRFTKTDRSKDSGQSHC